MKKFFSLVAIAAVAATMFTSCTKNDPDPTPGPTKAKLSLTAAPTTVAVAAEGTFTVTSDINAPEAIVVAVKSSDDKILTVNPSSVTIAKDSKVITGKYTGVANGKATITITTTAANTSILVGTVDITVGDAPVGGGDIQKLTIMTPDWNGFQLTNDDESIYFNFFEVSYLPGEFDGSIAMDLGVGTVIAMGELNANGYLCVAPQAAGTAIKMESMISSTKERPVIWSPADRQNYTALATGEDTYIAFACGDFESTSDEYRVWAKVNLKAAGGWSSFNVIEAYICYNDAEFKVGQKE